MEPRPLISKIVYVNHLPEYCPVMVKGYYASIYWKSGDLVGCYWCLTHTQTTEYSATQLVQSLKLKLSHAIIVIKIFDLSPTPTWLSILLSCGQQLLWLKKKEQKNVGGVCWTKLEIGRRVGLLGSEKVEGETPATGLVVTDTLSYSIQCLNFAKKLFFQYLIQYCFTQDSIQNIIQFKKTKKFYWFNSKYDFFIHFTVKFNSKDYSISFFFQEYSIQEIIQ